MKLEVCTESSGLRNRRRELKMSHVDVGEVPPMERTRPSLLLKLTHSLSRCGCGGEDSTTAHQADVVMNSEARHCSFSRSQFVHTGFFSSQRAWRDLQVKLNQSAGSTARTSCLTILEAGYLVVKPPSKCTSVVTCPAAWTSSPPFLARGLVVAHGYQPCLARLFVAGLALLMLTFRREDQNH